MPTCSLPKSGPTPALVSALKSVVFPAAGSPTIPTSSTPLVSRDLLLQLRERPVLQRLHGAFRLVQNGRSLAVGEVEDELQGQHLLLLVREVLDQLEHALPPDRRQSILLGRRLRRAFGFGHLLLGLPALRGAEVVHRQVVRDP